MCWQKCNFTQLVANQADYQKILGFLAQFWSWFSFLALLSSRTWTAETGAGAAGYTWVDLVLTNSHWIYERFLLFFVPCRRCWSIVQAFLALDPSRHSSVLWFSTTLLGLANCCAPQPFFSMQNKVEQSHGSKGHWKNSSWCALFSNRLIYSCTWPEKKWENALHQEELMDKTQRQEN